MAGNAKWPLMENTGRMCNVPEIRVGHNLAYVFDANLLIGY